MMTSHIKRWLAFEEFKLDKLYGSFICIFCDKRFFTRVELWKHHDDKHKK
jgi:hypothetical protein